MTSAPEAAAGQEPSDTPAPADPTAAAAREVEAANRAFQYVRRDLLEDALADIIRASARRDGIEL